MSFLIFDTHDNFAKKEDMKESVTSVKLLINGRQAAETLEQLTKKAEELRASIEAVKAKEAENPGGGSKSRNLTLLERDLESVERRIKLIQRNSKVTEQTLDWITTRNAKDLKAGMDYWQDQANSLTTGSKEWEDAIMNFFNYKADYEKIMAMQRNPLEAFLYWENQWREKAQAQAQADYEQGLSTYREYRKKMLEIDRDYYQMATTNPWLSNAEANQMRDAGFRTQDKLNQLEYAEQQRAQRKQQRDDWNIRINKIKEEYRLQQEELTRSYENQEITQRAFNEQKFRNEIDYLYKLKAVYRENSYDRHRTENEIQRKEQAHQQKKAEEFLTLKERIESSYFSERSEITKKSYAEEYEIAQKTLQAIIEERKAILRLQLRSGKISKKEYESSISELNRSLRKADDFLQRKFEQNGKKLAKDYYNEWFGTVTNEMGEEIEGLGTKIQNWAAVASSTLATIQQSVTQLVQTELEIQTSAIEQRYEREISYAEGNSYKVAKLERQKAKEMAKAKADAQRKTFALQVLSTVATTAQNAISAYGAALQIGGIAGLIMAPIAAAAAVAAGAIQIAVIKKQQEAAEGSYMVGGYTKKGKEDEIVGKVHAGEWVAPKSMVDSPRIAPYIEALEGIRTGKTVPDIRESAFDSARTQAIANNVLGTTHLLAYSEQRAAYNEQLAAKSIRIAQQSQQSLAESQAQISDLQEQNLQMTIMMAQMGETLAKLNKRLNEPFVTINTVTGDYGMQHAQDEYARLMKNKSPKSRR